MNLNKNLENWLICDCDFQACSVGLQHSLLDIGGLEIQTRDQFAQQS
jgi:hypothetical protein